MPVPLLRLSSPGPYAAPRLDPAQERVVAWEGPGTCVVLGGPGTGATTAIVEAVVAHLVEQPSARVLVLARDRDAVRRVRAAGGNILGVILTKSRALEAGESYSYQYGYYEYGKGNDRG